MNKLLLIVSFVLMAGCQIMSSENNIQENTIRLPVPVEAVENYLAINIGATGFNGSVFCAYDILGVEQKKNADAFYLWVLCQEFYQTAQQLEKGTGVSAPVAVTVEIQNSEWQISGHRVPRDGLDYGQDIKTIFPRAIWPKIIPRNDNERQAYNVRVLILEQANELKASAYFSSTR